MESPVNDKSDKISTLNSKKKFTDFFAEYSQTFRTARKSVMYVYKKQPRYMLYMLLTILGLAATPYLDNYVSAKLIDEIIAQTSSKFGSVNNIIWIMSIFLGISLISDLLHRLRNYAEYNLDERIDKNLMEDTAQKYSGLEQEYLDSPQHHDLINKAVQRYRMLLNSMRRIISILQSLVSVGINVVILFNFSPVLILLAATIAVPQAISNSIFTKKDYENWDRFSEKRRDAYRTHAYLQDEIRLGEIKTFRLGRYMLGRFMALINEYLNIDMSVYRKRTTVNTLLNIFGTVSNGISLVIIVSSVLAGGITVGLFSFYFRSVGRLSGDLNNLFSNLVSLYESSLHTKDLFTFLELPKVIIDGNTILNNKETPPIIEFRNVWFKYPQTDKYILQNFNLQITPGSHLAIVGENGAGKSTVIKLLLRFYDVNEGEILIDGINIKDLKLDSWYAVVGTLFQEFNFYHFDAKTNISVGNINKMSDFDNIVDAAKKAGAHDFIEKYDKKYDQVLSKSFSGGINPSIGQMQRVALARAFFRNSPILILDEPTSAIDAQGEYEIFQRLFEFAQGKSVIIISHRFSTVRNAQRIIVLDKGKIIEDGSHEDLIKIHEGKYKASFELQKKGYE